MRWIIAGCVATALAFVLPWAITASKKSARGKGRMAGAALAIGLAFGGIFDPATKAASEAAQKKKEIGDSKEDAGGKMTD
jgi:hypothetical protein